MYAGMYYASGQHYGYMKGEGTKWFFFLIVVGTNVAFFIYWIHLMRIELLKMAYNKNKKMFKLATCGFTNPKEFYQKYMLNDHEELGETSKPVI